MIPRISNTLNRIIHLLPCPQQPIKKPTQIIPRTGFPNSPKILRLRMLKFPSLKISLHNRIKLPHPIIPLQQLHIHRRTSVSVQIIIQSRQIIGRLRDGLDAMCLQLVQVEQFITRIILLPHHKLRKRTRLQLIRIISVHIPMLIISIDSLIHPMIIPLITPQYPIKPIMPHLMRNHIIQRLGAKTISTDQCNHRIFHSIFLSLCILNRRRMRIRILTHQIRIEQNRPIDILNSILPQILLLLRKQDRSFYLVSTFQCNRTINRMKLSICKPSKIMNVFSRITITQRIGITLVVHLVVPRSIYFIIPWNSDRHIKRPKLRIKLPLIQVRHCVPPLRIIHRRLRIPLRHLIRLPYMPRSRKIRRQFQSKRSGNHHRVSTFKRLRQFQLNNIRVRPIRFHLHSLPIHRPFQI